MRLVMYAGGSFVTTDEIADALLEYATALVNASLAAVVRVPRVGEPGDVQMMLGPSSQLMSEHTEQVGTEPDSSEFMDAMRLRTAALRSDAVPRDVQTLDWEIY